MARGPMGGPVALAYIPPLTRRTHPATRVIPLLPVPACDAFPKRTPSTPEGREDPSRGASADPARARVLRSK